MDNQTSESLRLGGLLAIVGGFLDAYTYSCRNQIFANAQTGNIVKLGLAFTDGKYMKIIRYLIPIIAFVIGILSAMLIRDKTNVKCHLHWRQSILFLEAIIIIIVSFIPISYNFNILATTLISFLCAMQTESFKKILKMPFSSTMCTGNLRSGTEYLYQTLKSHNKDNFKIVKYYLSIILFFIIGVIMGVYSTDIFFEKGILIVLLPLSYSIVYMGKSC